MPIATATPQRNPLKRRAAWILVILAVIAFVVAGCVAMNPFSNNGENATSNTPDPTQSATTNATTALAVACDPRFVQVEVDRSSSKTDIRYPDLVRPIYDDASLSDADRKAKVDAVELFLAGTNAQTLADFAESVKLYSNVGENWRELVDGGNIVNGGCLSEKGREIYFKLDVLYTATGNVTTRELTDAEAAAFNNSGTTNTMSVVADGPGIYGDRAAVVRTLPDGSKVIRLVRCGNTLWITIPPGKPHGPTDNPPPPVCEWNPSLPPNSPDCHPPSEGKDDSKSVTPPNGWDRQGTGTRTNGNESEGQKSSGQTRGNVTDNQVGGNTKSGSTTTDMGSNGGTSPVAPGATPGGDDRSKAVVDSGNTNQNNGGTNGDTEIAPPKD